jgi:hypothetical protein
VTETSDGAVVALTVGQHVMLELPPEWTPPKLSGAGLGVVAQSGGYPSGQPLRATLVAVTVGTAYIDSGTDYACLHQTPRCLPPVKQLRVTVKITG